MKKSNTLVYLCLVFFLGLFLRFYRLTEFPPSLNWDEVSHAYNSFSLLHTGHDQWGQFLPLFNFRAYGDYPASLNIILTVVPIALFGAVDFAVRLPHALFGSLTILTTFAAAYYWRKNSKIALLAALFVCIDPWTLFPSRVVFQSNLAVFFLSLGLAFYFKKDNFKAVLFWGISLYTYHNTRIFIPLLIAPLLFQHFKNKRLMLTFLFLYIPMLIALLTPAARARNAWVGIIDSGVISGIESSRNSSLLPFPLPKLIYNKPAYFLTKTAQHYVGYFSPQYLFLSGGTQYQFSLPGFGVLPWVNLPFFYIGLFMLFRKKDKFLIYWLMLAPLPAAVTRDSFAVIRSTTMLPIVQLVTAFGLFTFLSNLKKYHLTMAVSVAYGVLLYAFLEQYLITYITTYPIKYSQSWQYGYKQIADINPASFSQVVITKRYGEPHEYILWYRQLLPHNIKWDYHANWYWVNALSNYSFVNDWDMEAYTKALPAGKYLFIGSPDNYLPGTLINQINFLDGAPAFIIKTYEK